MGPSLDGLRSPLQNLGAQCGNYGRSAAIWCPFDRHEAGIWRAQAGWARLQSAETARKARLQAGRSIGRLRTIADGLQSNGGFQNERLQIDNMTIE